jgi:hypothetical protein
MAMHNFLSKSVAAVCGQVGYHFSPSGKPYPDNWIISDVFFENEGGTLQSRSGVRVSGTSNPASGDVTV